MSEAAGEKPTVSFDDFLKLDIRVGKVLEVSDHPNADKLYVMKVDLGGEARQLLAGLRPYCPPEGLRGRDIIVVTNLEPRKIRGLESRGMLLAATCEEGGEKKVVILTTDAPVPPGSPIA